MKYQQKEREIDLVERNYCFLQQQKKKHCPGIKYQQKGEGD